MTKPAHLWTREDMAKAEVGHTDVTGPVKAALIAAFLAIVATGPLVHFGGALVGWLRGTRESPVPQAFGIYLRVPEAVQEGLTARGSVFGRVIAANRRMLRSIETFEAELKEEDALLPYVQAPAQRVLTEVLGSGNEQAYVGRGGWTFYRPDIDYATGPGFLEEAQLARRAAAGSEIVAPPQPDPRKAIRQFHTQLAARGIALIVMPTPVKPTVHPARFSGRYEGRAEPVQNPSYAALLSDLEEAGVRVFDPAPALVEWRQAEGAPQYLATDTHWRPDAMERVAAALAASTREHVALPEIRPPAWRVETRTETNVGDVARLLGIDGQAETVETRAVLGSQGQLWRAEKTSDVLLLGDSFSNIYSLGAMGWGESAGLAEHLAVALQRPIDRIVRNSDGAFATREILARELARGRDRLAGARVVVWQFADRELSIGDWKLLEMELGTPPEEQFVVAPLGETLTVTATVAIASSVPKPGTVPYKEHFISLHLVDLESEGGAMTDGQAVVYVRSMTDGKWTDAARLRIGDRVTMELVSWQAAVEADPGVATINRSELADATLVFQEFNLGTLVEGADVLAAREPVKLWPIGVLAGILTACLALRMTHAIAPRREPRS